MRINYDLAIAVARVQEARAVAAEARSEYWPALNYGTITSYGHNQFTGSPASNLPGAQGFFLGIARASWEADLWGRIRRTNEAARARLLESESVRRGVMLTLVSDVSEAYFELLGLKLKLEIARQTTQSFGATFDLFNTRMREGLGNGLQTSRAAAEVATAAAAIPLLERAIALKENQISVLAGRNPGPVDTRVKLLDEAVPLDVPAGLPSALLERRPRRARGGAGGAIRERANRYRSRRVLSLDRPDHVLRQVEHAAERAELRQHQRVESRSEHGRPDLSGRWSAGAPASGVGGCGSRPG